MCPGFTQPALLSALCMIHAWPLCQLVGRARFHFMGPYIFIASRLDYKTRSGENSRYRLELVSLLPWGRSVGRAAGAPQVCNVTHWERRHLAPWVPSARETKCLFSLAPAGEQRGSQASPISKSRLEQLTSVCWVGDTWRSRAAKLI